MVWRVYDPLIFFIISRPIIYLHILLSSNMWMSLLSLELIVTSKSRYSITTSLVVNSKLMSYLSDLQDNWSISWRLYTMLYTHGFLWVTEHLSPLRVFLNTTIISIIFLVSSITFYLSYFRFVVLNESDTIVLYCTVNLSPTWILKYGMSLLAALSWWLRSTRCFLRIRSVSFCW